MMRFCIDLEQTTEKSDVGTVPSLSSKLKNEKNLAFAQFIKKHVQKGFSACVSRHCNA